MAFSSHFFKGMHQLWLSTKIMYCGCYFVHMAVIVFARSLQDKSLPRSIFYSLEVNNYVPCTLKVWGVMFHFLEGGVSMEDVWNSSAQICPLSFICWFIYLITYLFMSHLYSNTIYLFGGSTCPKFGHGELFQLASMSFSLTLHHCLVFTFLLF